MAAARPSPIPALSARELELLEAVCAGAEVAAAWLDAELNLPWCCRRFAEWFPKGLPATAPDVEGGWEAAARAVLERGEVARVLLPQECATGGARWVELGFRPWEGGLLVIARDVTLRRHVEEGLLRGERLDSLGAVAAGVAHDFNNYLTGILGVAGLLREGLPEGDPQGELVSRLEGAARAAAGLARQILDYSRDAGDVEGRADLRLCVQEVAALMRHSLDPRIEVRVDPGDAPAPVPLAAGRAQQILMNLCCNARDAMPAGGVLELGVRVHGSEATLRVRDTGMGMTEEVRRRIFEPFFTTKEPGRGTGLGLAVCREIVTAAGGAIRVESVPGEGTLFEIHLPLAAPEASVTQRSPEVEAAGGHTILVVDDEPLIRMVAERFLERAGYRVVSAGGGEEALERLRREGAKIDLVLLDLTMPGMRGPQVVAALRAFLPDLPVVITSGYSEQSVTQATWAHEVQGFLAKP
ncbi:MAG: response regulator, partial [Nitrospirae bacterium]